MYKLHIQRHPFKSKVDEFTITNNSTLEDAYNASDPILPIDNVKCTMNGEVVTDFGIIPKDGDIVSMKVFPGNDTVTNISMGFVGLGLAADFTGLLLAGLGVAAGPLVISIGVGIALVACIVGSISQAVTEDKEKGGSARQDVYGASGSAERWSPIPLVYGEHLVAPTLVSSDWTSLTADETPQPVLHQLYVVGDQNPDWHTSTIIDSVSIGTDRLFNTKELKLTGSISVTEPGVSATLTIGSASSTFSTYFNGAPVGTTFSISGSNRPQNNRQFKVLSYTSNTLTFKADGYVTSDTANFTIKRLVDAGIFEGVSAEIVSDGDFSGSPYPHVVYEAYMGKTVKHSVDETNKIYFTTPNFTKTATVGIVCPSGLYSLHKTDKRTTTLSVRIEAKLIDDEVWQDRGLITISNQKTTEVLRKNINISFLTTGQWMLRFTKETADFLPEEGVNTVVIDRIVCQRTNKEGDLLLPVNPDIATAFSFLALQITANEQLNGSISNLNFMLRHELHAYDEVTNSWVPAFSNNPAAVFVDVLLNPARNKYPLSTAVDWNNLLDIPIDWDTIQEWYSYCEDNALTCNGVISSFTTIRDELTKIALAGRANFTIKDGLYTVVLDDVRPSPVQLFTPRNTNNFSAKRSYVNKVDGVRVKFINADIGYQEDELVIDYPDSAKKEYDELNLEYVTNPAQAKKYGKYYLNVKNIRQEQFTFSTDLEYIICTVGDRIKFQHDVPLLGIISSRVVSVVDNGYAISSIIIDEPVTMEEGKAYAIDIRLQDASRFYIASLDVEFDEGPTTEIKFVPPQPLGSIQRGFLLTFGEVEAVTEDLVVVDLSPGEDLTASLTCVKYDPSIYDLDNFTVWESSIGLPASAPRKAYILGDTNREVISLINDTSRASYLHIKYSVNPDGNPMQDSPATYVGVLTNYNSIASDDHTLYTWSRFEGLPGEDAISIQLYSSNGDAFREGTANTTLSCYVFQGDANITDTLPDSNFNWTRVSTAGSIADAQWATLPKAVGHKQIAILPSDVVGRTVFSCEVDIV